MKYINKETRQLIIETPVHKSTTTIKTKKGELKENIKYIAHIPNELLIFLLETYKPYDPKLDDAQYIDNMLNSDEKYYLSFYDNPDLNQVQLQVTNYKIAPDNGASVTIKKQGKINSYFFTVSKKVFTELKNYTNSNYKFRYVLDLDNDSDCFKNSIINVEIV